MTPQQIFEERIPKRLSENPKLKAALNATILFDISGEEGGKWLLDATKESDWVSAEPENATPATTISLSDKDFVAMVNKKRNAQALMMAGKLKIKPMRLELARAMGKLLS